MLWRSYQGQNQLRLEVPAPGAIILYEAGTFYFIMRARRQWWEVCHQLKIRRVRNGLHVKNSYVLCQCFIIKNGGFLPQTKYFFIQINGWQMGPERPETMTKVELRLLVWLFSYLDEEANARASRVSPTSRPRRKNLK